MPHADIYMLNHTNGELRDIRLFKHVGWIEASMIETARYVPKSCVLVDRVKGRTITLGEDVEGLFAEECAYSCTQFLFMRTTATGARTIYLARLALPPKFIPCGWQQRQLCSMSSVLTASSPPNKQYCVPVLRTQTNLQPPPSKNRTQVHL